MPDVGHTRATLTHPGERQPVHRLQGVQQVVMIEPARVAARPDTRAGDDRGDSVASGALSSSKLSTNRLRWVFAHAMYGANCSLSQASPSALGQSFMS